MSEQLQQMADQLINNLTFVRTNQNCYNPHCTHVANHLLEEFVNMLIVEVARYVHAWTSVSVNKSSPCQLVHQIWRVASWSCNLSASRAYFVLLSAWKSSIKIFQHRNTRSPSSSLQASVNSDIKAAKWHKTRA